MQALYENRRQNLRVAESYIRDFWISTVFLSLDHGFGSPVPIVFETMILKGHRWLGFQDRYATGKKAAAAHVKLDKLARMLLLKAPQISSRNFEAVLSRL